MAVQEVCMLLGAHDVVLWADAAGMASALPDSRSRWEAIWQHRDRLLEISHSHPTGGAFFSAEDETTMAALDDAMGRKLVYSLVTPDVLLRRTAAGEATVSPEPWWCRLMRLASGLD